jgi:hypothetical protein
VHGRAQGLARVLVARHRADLVPHGQEPREARVRPCGALRPRVRRGIVGLHDIEVAPVRVHTPEHEHLAIRAHDVEEVALGGRGRLRLEARPGHVVALVEHLEIDADVLELLGELTEVEDTTTRGEEQQGKAGPMHHRRQ